MHYLGEKRGNFLTLGVKCNTLCRWPGCVWDGALKIVDFYSFFFFFVIIVVRTMGMFYIIVTMEMLNNECMSQSALLQKTEHGER